MPDARPAEPVLRRAVPPAARSLFLGLTLLAGACASTPAGIVLPAGSGNPLAPELYEPLFVTAIASCRSVRTMELMMALQGRSGETRLRGRVRGALAEPGSIRLEVLAPFGAPVAILAAAPGAATLVQPRDRRVTTGALAEDLLQTLAGITLGPDEFRAVMTGCLVPTPRPVGGRSIGDDYIAVELDGGTTAFIRSIDGVPHVVAGSRAGLVVEYGEHVRGLPRRVRVQSAAGTVPVIDLTARLSQVNINVELAPTAFVVRVPDDYVPMTLEELRGRPPLEVPDEPGAPAPPSPGPC
jgi:hypothetical protein